MMFVLLFVGANVISFGGGWVCSRDHLSRVLHGRRKAGARLAKALRRMGIEVEVA